MKPTFRSDIIAGTLGPIIYTGSYTRKYNGTRSVFDYSSNATAAMSSSPTPQNRYYNEYHEGLLELAKGSLKILLNHLVDKTMVAAVKADVK